jgi:hypothetical protein
MKPPGSRCFITIVLHRRILYLKNLVGQVAPQALPDAYETTKFLFRSDWTLAASGGAYMKLHFKSLRWFHPGRR